MTGPVRAAVLRAHGDAPAVEERADPVGTGDAVVRVTAVPLTPLDLLCAGGTSYFGPPALPYVPGVQGVGEVVAHPTLKPGSRVWFPTDAGMQPGDGALATTVHRPAADLVDLGDHDVPAEHVAAIGLSGVAAWLALAARAELQEGEQVLVLGAGGVVGQVGVQAARLLGARRVLAAARSAGARARARQAGADAVVALEDGDSVADVVARVREVADGPVDVVLDPLAGVPGSAGVRLLGEHGRLVNLGSSAAPGLEVVSADLRSRTAAVLGYTNNAVSVGQKAETLRTLLGHAAAGRLHVDHEVVPLDDVAAAWGRQAAGQAPVRIVVELRG
ncbi:zinc-binding dehydrogenase [Nocardioides iriomotensis]|uniref:Zinc-binding alcohol dehydrogenase family protein n=1 Tax=Nocardioides iriomotensis TaxID=715784 RepID=A0A4V1Z268_9ACTN|nr:zinc-binding dehydrogenase [Nocardioides iriomotensis]RYU13356.1 zinc-binding alcohol dehydrogenase family protein [Nocardioides iriomotensis]